MDRSDQCEQLAKAAKVENSPTNISVKVLQLRLKILLLTFIESAVRLWIAKSQQNENIEKKKSVDKQTNWFQDACFLSRFMQ